MSIKLPATMVFYGESENRPHYLLWWIPAEAYASIKLDEGSLADLLVNYPNGLEIEVQEEVLAEVGLHLSQWGVTAPELQAAFLQIHNEGKLPTSGLVQADKLIQLASALDRDGKKSIHELLTQPNQSLSFSGPSEISLGEEVALEENPEMTSGEDAEDFFKRISGL